MTAACIFFLRNTCEAKKENLIVIRRADDFFRQREAFRDQLLQPQGPQQFQRMKIIGVMKDFNIKSMHIPIEPVCFTVLGNFGGDQYVAVRLTGEDVSGTVRAIEQKWQTFKAASYSPADALRLEK